MVDVLFLTHRLPYPPDKGEKIRCWNVLRHIASRHQVHLAGFIDEPEQTGGLEELRKICASVTWRPLLPRFAKLRSLPSLLTGAPLTQGYFADGQLRAEIDAIIARQAPSVFYVFSSAMAPYVFRHRSPGRVIIDMVDVDFEKWRQYAEASSGLARLVYRREGRTLLGLERRAARTADAIVFVSPAEAELFARLAPEAAARSHGIINGVDVDHFRPELDVPNPLGGRPGIVFTGVMNYRPNVDGMCWFVREVMPRLRARRDAPCLWIVGSNPSRPVLALAGPDIRVTGRVPDVRPYLRHAAAVVAPLRLARGIQNKVLEGMAMGAAVVATPQAREGLERCREDELPVAATAAEFATAVERLLDGEAAAIGARARARVVRDYGWQLSLAALDRLIESAPHHTAERELAPAATELAVSA